MPDEKNESREEPAASPKPFEAPRNSRRSADNEDRSPSGAPPQSLLVEAATFLPILGISVRWLIRNPRALGAYLPSIVVGFVEQLRKLEDARADRYRARAARLNAQDERDLDARERELLRELPLVRGLVAEAITDSATSLAELQSKLASETDLANRASILAEISEVRHRLTTQLRAQTDLEAPQHHEHAAGRDIGGRV
ncbi:hypothetical protein ACIRRA_15725 [Nocardia sp. NPDC101769]|uniref:hypothetical protein n=1 Tax=Nocardia sp. NPDC101769 TaxID=3364333 RepID=UPI00381D8B99